jgi:hypothetical protein
MGSSVLPTKCHGWVVNTPASYSGGPGFNSWPWWLAILIDVFRGFPQSLQANITLKLGHDCFLPISFQFIIIHFSPYHRRYIVYLLKNVVK